MSLTTPPAAARTARPLAWLLEQRPLPCTAAGWVCLQLGLLLLPLSAVLASTCLVLACTAFRPPQEPRPLQRGIARWLLLLAVLLVLTSAVASTGWLAWIGLLNWLPFFWLFLALQPYLSTAAARRRLAVCVALASVPVILVGWIQMATGWHGEFKTLAGLVLWAMAHPSRATGIFEHPNITATWLALALPLVASLISAPLGNTKGLQPQAAASGERRRQLAFGLGTAATLATILFTGSRNAILISPLALVLAIPRRLRLVVAALLGLYGLALVVKTTTGLSSPLLDPFMSDLLTSKFSRLGLQAQTAIAEGEGRLEAYPLALKLIASHPWHGLGETGFASLYASLNPQIPRTALIHHSHNVVLEMAVSHGIPATLVLLGVMGTICFQGLRALQQRRDPGPNDGRGGAVDRAWVIAAAVAIWTHQLDIPLFDVRVNVVGWLCFAALWSLANPRPSPEAVAPATTTPEVTGAAAAAGPQPR